MIFEAQVIWQLPPLNYIKINVRRCKFCGEHWCGECGGGGPGLISEGVIVSSWDFIGLCKSMEEAEHALPDFI